MTKQSDALQKQIEAVKIWLLRGVDDPHANYLDDGRAGAALAKKDVAQISSGSGWHTYNRYVVRVNYTGQLSKIAYQWCVANGLKPFADEYNVAALKRYAAYRLDQERGRLEVLQKEMAKLVSTIAFWEKALETGEIPQNVN